MHTLLINYYKVGYGAHGILFQPVTISGRSKEPGFKFNRRTIWLLDEGVKMLLYASVSCNRLNQTVIFKRVSVVRGSCCWESHVRRGNWIKFSSSRAFIPRKCDLTTLCLLYRFKCWFSISNSNFDSPKYIGDDLLSGLYEIQQTKLWPESNSDALFWVKTSSVCFWVLAIQI